MKPKFENKIVESTAFTIIAKALTNAKKKHPRFASDLYEINTVISSEMGEISTAILREPPENIVLEMAHCAATCIRGMCFVIEQNGGKEGLNRWMDEDL